MALDTSDGVFWPLAFAQVLGDSPPFGKFGRRVKLSRMTILCTRCCVSGSKLPFGWLADRFAVQER
jgi:hypothetical protein